MRRMAVLLLVCVMALSLFAQQQGNERFITVITRFVDAIKAGDYAAIVQDYTKEMLANTPLNKTTIFFQNLESQYGKVIKIDQPQIVAGDQAKWVMYFERGVQDWTICLDDQGKIRWFLFTTHVAPEPSPAPTPAPATTVSTPAPQVSPQPTAPVVPDKQQTELYLPFKGNWVVLYGGEFREGAAQRNLLLQQYAYEFSAMDGEGHRYKNDGKSNEDYFGYGKEVLAPANGIVIEAIDGIRENSPGTRNPYAPIGNAIIIQHSLKEYSVLAYLKQGSIQVKVGDKVTKGQVLAQCGNSGNATEPVIHYHLQDSPFMQTADGVKFYIEQAFVTTKEKKELKVLYLPMIGDILSSE